MLDGRGSSDADDDPLTYVWTGSFGVATGPTPTVILPLGTHVITLTVDDGKGGTDSDSVVVIVEDTSPPDISAISADPDNLWPPNHKMISVEVQVSATDNCDDTPICKIITVESDEPINGPGDGNTDPDWEITGDLTLQLRAERSGKGDGRSYIITVACDDVSGNTSNGTVTVDVPHNKGKK